MIDMFSLLEPNKAGLEKIFGKKPNFLQKFWKWIAGLFVIGIALAATNLPPMTNPSIQSLIVFFSIMVITFTIGISLKYLLDGNIKRLFRRFWKWFICEDYVEKN